MRCMPDKLIWDAKEHLRLVERKVDKRLGLTVEHTDFMVGATKACTGEGDDVLARMEELSRAEIYSNAFL